MTRYLTGLLCVFTLTAASPAEEPDSQQRSRCERWDRAVCLVTERKKTDGSGAASSAFLVAHADNLFLITANHSALETHAHTRVVYRTIEGESRWVHLGGLTVAAANPWVQYENTDLSVLRIAAHPQISMYVDELRELAIPFSALLAELPGRTTAIEITGFPISLGIQPQVSPLTMTARIASRELQADAQWGKEAIVYAVPTVGAGCSGGPVFLASEDASATSVVGMYIGLMVDTTGAKLSKIIPARILRAAIEKHPLNQPPAMPDSQ
ncbi:MAG: hypothetical protein R3C12_08345 [Planctomycetaceae bacterium]|nr:hypothetical protein [Planctomycetaceae bacterium]